MSLHYLLDKESHTNYYSFIASYKRVFSPRTLFSLRALDGCQAKEETEEAAASPAVSWQACLCIEIIFMLSSHKQTIHYVDPPVLEKE